MCEYDPSHYDTNMNTNRIKYDNPTYYDKNTNTRRIKYYENRIFYEVSIRQELLSCRQNKISLSLVRIFLS